MTAEELSPAEILDGLKDQEKDIGVRKTLARKLGDLPSDNLNPVLAGLPSVIDELYERRENSEELALFGVTLRSLGQLCFTFPKNKQVKGLLITRIEKMDVEEQKVIEHAFNALKKAVHSHPDLTFEVSEKIKQILSGDAPLSLKKLVLEVVTRAAWLTPHILSDFTPELTDMLEAEDEQVREAALHAVYRISRKNYYVVSSFIKELIPESVEEADKDTLFLLTHVDFPPEENETSARIFELAEEVFLAEEDPTAVVRAGEGLAHLVEKKELSQLQQQFAEDLRIKIEEAEDDEEKAGLLSAAAIPNWADMGTVEPLVTLASDVLMSGIESKEVKVAAAESIHSILLLYNEFSEVVVDTYLQALDSGWGEELKIKIINLLASIPLLADAEKERMLESLLELVTRRGEGILARLTAVDALTDFAPQIPEIVREYGDAVVEAFKSVTFTDLRRSLIELSGKILEETRLTERNPFLTILVEGLNDRDLYSLSLEKLYSVAYHTPKALIEYREQLLDFPEKLAAIEGEVDVEQVETRDRMSYFERPKRLYTRILAELLEAEPDIVEMAVNTFLDTLEATESQNLIKEVAYALSTAHDISPATVEQVIDERDIAGEKIDTIRSLLGGL